MKKTYEEYDEPIDLHYRGYRGMCTQMGVSLNELYKDELDDDYFD